MDFEKVVMDSQMTVVDSRGAIDPPLFLSRSETLEIGIVTTFDSFQLLLTESSSLFLAFTFCEVLENFCSLVRNRSLLY